MKPNLLTDLLILASIVLLARCGGEVTPPAPGPTPEEKVSCVLIGTPALADHAYSWSPVKGLKNPSAAQTLACPTKSTTYTVTAVTKCGKATSDVTVKVMKIVDGQLVEQK